MVVGKQEARAAAVSVGPSFEAIASGDQ
jgi:hypothetical protein